LEQVEAAIGEFERCLDGASAAELKAKLKKIIPEYTPYEENSHSVLAPALDNEPASDLIRT
jgi:hypothetical protein